MYKAFIYFFLFINASFLKAQTQFGPNLVYNGGFEILDSCPQYINGQNFAQEFPYVSGWYSPNWQTPDVFNTCAPYILTGGAAVPDNFWGFQWPHSGNGYGGFWFACGEDFAEYIQTRMLDTIRAGKTYTIKCYLSPAYDTLEGPMSGVNHIGFLFTPNKIDTPSLSYFHGYTPQFTSGPSFINDTNIWTKVSGIFSVDEDCQWLTIGKFNHPLQYGIDFISLRNDTLGGTAYYYIDDLSIRECLDCPDPIFIPNVFTPNDDGKNDTFSVSGFSSAPFRVIILNRWGKVILESSDRKFKWDGKLNDENLAEGVYYYLIQSGEKSYKGFVHLIR